MDIEEIRRDIAAFADREDAVDIDKGFVVFERDRQTVECQLRESAGGQISVHLGDRAMPYSRFLGEELGRLSVLAEAIKQKRPDISPYVDTRASLTTTATTTDPPILPSSGFELLRQQCESRNPGYTSLIFLTADAGEGKTALLRRLTRHAADRYSAGKARWLLLHVDTQGRSFVRLEEAVAKDLGQLRISGLFYSGIIRLVRHGLVTIAVDGFDELLAEIGSGEAYSGLGAFLKQLSGQGTVIAAARSAYFEAENYTAQSQLLLSLPNTQVEVEHMKLHQWRREEAVKLFEGFRHEESGGRIEDPAGTYDNLAEILGADHLVLHSPFLVFRMAMMLATKLMTPSEIKEEIGSSGFSVVPKVIRSFLEREVSQKWRDLNGNPYLTIDQHIKLLSMVADEMWYQSTNRLPVEVIQLVAETLLDGWSLTQKARIQVIERVKAHALLPVATPPGDRSFDHEEFLNYFLAERLAALLEDQDHEDPLCSFLEKHPLPKIVGKWISVVRSRSDEEAGKLIANLSTLAAKEVRSTYLKQNLGLIASNIASASERLAGVKLEGMYFEGDEWKGSRVRAATFERCTFIDVDLDDCVWDDCHFISCQVEGLTYNNTTKLDGSSFDENCHVSGILSHDGSPTSLRSYVPHRCQAILESLGVHFPQDEQTQSVQLRPIRNDLRACLEAFLRIFSRTTGATENTIDRKLGTRFPLFRKSMMPTLIGYGLVRKTDYRGRGHQDRFELAYPVEQILKAENPEAAVPSILIRFWDKLRDL